MTLPPFDGSEYRRTVLTPLRAASPGAVDDVFWLGHVPRDLDDPAAITARLRETKAFLHKERARPRQADVAAAVLREWPRVEGVLADPAARRSLRTRLGAAPAIQAVAAAGPNAARATTDRSNAEGAPAAAGPAPAARRETQVRSALGELARLREDPDLAEDLFAFLGLPLTATKPMIEARMEQVAGVNRRRRADRERSLVDELLMHAREQLVEGPAPAPFPAPPPVAPPVDGLTVSRDGGDAHLTWSWPEGVTEVWVAVGAGCTPTDPGQGEGRKVTNMRYDLDGGVRLAAALAPPGTVVRVFSGRRDPSGTLAWNDPAHARETIAP